MKNIRQESNVSRCVTVSHWGCGEYLIIRSLMIRTLTKCCNCDKVKGDEMDGTYRQNVIRHKIHNKYISELYNRTETWETVEYMWG